MAYIPTLLGNSSPIGYLPPEILLRIFEYAYIAAHLEFPATFPCYDSFKVEKECFRDMEPEGGDICDEDVMPSPFAQFPTSLASVCSRWEEIMLRVPAFWTRLVINLDADNFSPRRLGLRLCASRDRPIKVVITTTLYSNAEGAKDIEQSRMIEIITALRSHIHRCRILQIRAVYSSSLPRLLAILPPKMPHIEGLWLRSLINSGCPKVQPYSQSDHADSIDWGKLNLIMIDGWNFAELCSCTPSPNEQIFSKCRSLVIKFGGDGISSNYIKRLIRGCCIEYFEVDSVAFTEGDEPEQFSFIHSFTLRNLNAEVTAIMLGVCRWVDEITIDNCPSTLITKLPGPSFLVLKNIGSNQGFSNFVRKSDGSNLDVIACSGFNDDVLHLMATMSKNGRNPHGPHPYSLEQLVITDCHNFTAGALKHFVDKKSVNFGWLTVEKCRFPLPEDDFRWFQERLYEFSWKTSEALAP